MDLYSMIEAGGKMKLEVSCEDLVKFADRLIEKSMEAKVALLSQEKAEEWLTADETAKIFKISNTTLWSWDKSGYLRATKVGRKRLFARSDIDNILKSRNKSAITDMDPVRAEYCKHPHKD